MLGQVAAALCCLAMALELHGVGEAQHVERARLLSKAVELNFAGKDGPEEHPNGDAAKLTFACKDASEDFNMIYRPDVIGKQLGLTTEQFADVLCGNAVTLVGGDQLLLKSGTLTTLENAHNIAGKMYSVSPVVKVAVKGEDEDGKDWPKLVKGLMVLSKADPVASCTTEENGEHVVAGCGELNVEVCLKGVRGDDAQCDFAESDPVMS